MAAGDEDAPRLERGVGVVPRRADQQDATAGFPFGMNFPALEWLTTGRSFEIIPNSVIALAGSRPGHCYKPWRTLSL